METETRKTKTRPELQALLKKLNIALSESVRLQSHYARLLNQYDGGTRIIFQSAEEWIERLREIGRLT